MEITSGVLINAEQQAGVGVGEGGIGSSPTFHGVNTSTAANFKLPTWNWEDMHSGTHVVSHHADVIDVRNLRAQRVVKCNQIIRK